MKGLIDALRLLGADIRCIGAEGFLPLEIRPSGLRGGEVTIDARESSQMLSALLMVSPLAEGARRRGARRRRQDALRADDDPPDGAIRGRELDGDGDRSPWARPYHSPGRVPVEPDATRPATSPPCRWSPGDRSISTGLARRREPPGRRPVPRRPGKVRGQGRRPSGRDHGLVREPGGRRCGVSQTSRNSRTRS
jgi:hypothetical protein